jgi:hypothetical protein
VFVDVVPQPLSICTGIRESDVAIRPDKIECVAQESDLPHFLPPLKNMEWKLKFGADFG